jgi:hypothetical protein
MGDESRFIASKRIHRHRRCCAHCEEILGLVTVICPRCDRLATTWWHKLMSATLAGLALFGLLKALELI